MLTCCLMEVLIDTLGDNTGLALLCKASVLLADNRNRSETNCFRNSKMAGDQTVVCHRLGRADFLGISELMPATVEKKCSRCGEPFSCQQEAVCWCATMRLDPATLAELRARFSDCLCQACLRMLAPNEKVAGPDA
jgi:cysteine-rich CWC protein